MIILPSKKFIQVKSGSFTLANSRLSLIDGTAFCDFGVDIATDYAGLDTGAHKYMIQVFDNLKRCIWAYIGAVGGGETFGGEKVNDGDMSNPGSWILNNFVISGGVATANGEVCTMYQNVGAAVGGLYRISYEVISFIFLSRLYFSGGGFTPSEGISNTVGVHVYNRIAVDTDPLFFFADVADTFVMDDVSVKQVTDCAATGVHIISTQSGSVQNWASKHASFDMNDEDGYAYKIFRVR